jgi:hypothetical protein
MSFEVILYITAAIVISAIFLIARSCYKYHNDSNIQPSSLTTSQAQAQEEDFLPHYAPARVNTGELPPPYYH